MIYGHGVHKKVQQAFGIQKIISFLSISPFVSFLIKAVSTAEVMRLPWGLCSLPNRVTNLGTTSVPSSVIHSKRGTHLVNLTWISLPVLACYLYHYGVASMVVGRINNAECFLNTIYQHNLSVLMGTFKKKHFRKDTNPRLPGVLLKQVSLPN